MNTRWKHLCDGCLFMTMSSPEKLALENDQFFYSLSSVSTACIAFRLLTSASFSCHSLTRANFPCYLLTSYCCVLTVFLVQCIGRSMTGIHQHGMSHMVGKQHRTRMQRSTDPSPPTGVMGTGVVCSSRRKRHSTRHVKALFPVTVHHVLISGGGRSCLELHSSHHNSSVHKSGLLRYQFDSRSTADDEERLTKSSALASSNNSTKFPRSPSEAGVLRKLPTSPSVIREHDGLMPGNSAPNRLRCDLPKPTLPCKSYLMGYYSKTSSTHHPSSGNAQSLSASAGGPVSTSRTSLDTVNNWVHDVSSTKLVLIIQHYFLVYVM